MGVEKVHIEQFLELSKQHPVLDVRSPGEYKHAHIPGAISFPLFTDEERKIVGTAYKQESREKAIKIGLDFFGPKMRSMVEEAESIISRQLAVGNHDSSRLPTANCLLVHCWRGGMRSSAIAWLLDLYGFKVYTLTGGYKKFRNLVLDTFRDPYDFKVLGGFTGSGKTDLLKDLKRMGEPVIDLEAIANHKGSAFGNIGLSPQPSQEMFENLLALELIKTSILPDSPPVRLSVWVEDEAQRVGLVNIPHELWKTMRRSPVYFLDIPFEERLEYVVKEYGELDREKMLNAIERIQEKLGGVNAKTASQLLNEGNTLESFRILLKYYDKFYLKALHNRENVNSLLHSVECKSITSENASQLIRYIRFKPETNQA